MKFTTQFDGVADRKSLVGFNVLGEDGKPTSKATLATLWLRKADLGDNIPDGYEVTLTPIFKGGRKPAVKSAKPKAAKPKAAKPAEQKAA